MKREDHSPAPERRSMSKPEPDQQPLASPPQWCFENIATLSRSARTIHLIYVGFLIFCGLTLINTSDRQMILNERARLPLLNVDVTFFWFLVTAPLVAICMFVWFQVHVQSIKRALRELNVAYVLPTRRLYPWTLNLAEESEVGGLGVLQKLIVRISLWWLLPIVLFLFTAYAMRIGSISLFYWELLTSATGVILVVWLHRRYQNIPTQDQQINPLAWMEKHLIHIVLGMILFRVVAVVLPVSGTPRTESDIDLSNQMMRGASLRNRSLESINLEFANLEDADLSWSRLQSARLAGAILKNTNLRNSNLASANLSCANLSGANLENANLMETSLLKADLSGAFVTSYQLAKATTLYQAKIDSDVLAELMRDPNTSRLLKSPPFEAQEIESYQAQLDPVPIATWQITADSPGLLESGFFGKRTLISRSDVLVRRGDNGPFVIMTFFLTKSTEGISYIRAEAVSRLAVPCPIHYEQGTGTSGKTVN